MMNGLQWAGPGSTLPAALVNSIFGLFPDEVEGGRADEQDCAAVNFLTEPGSLPGLHPREIKIQELVTIAVSMLLKDAPHLHAADLSAGKDSEFPTNGAVVASTKGMKFVVFIKVRAGGPWSQGQGALSCPPSPSLPAAAVP